MEDYEKFDSGTIDTKVGEKITIRNATPPPFTGVIDFPEGAFEIDEDQSKSVLGKHSYDSTLDIYVLEVMKEGKFEVEYKRMDPIRLYDRDVFNADVYIVNVAPKD